MEWFRSACLPPTTVAVLITSHESFSIGSLVSLFVTKIITVVMVCISIAIVIGRVKFFMLFLILRTSLHSIPVSSVIANIRVASGTRIKDVIIRVRMKLDRTRRTVNFRKLAGSAVIGIIVTTLISRAVAFLVLVAVS